MQFPIFKHTQKEQNSSFLLGGYSGIGGRGTMNWETRQSLDWFTVKKFKGALTMKILLFAPPHLGIFPQQP